MTMPDIGSRIGTGAPSEAGADRRPFVPAATPNQGLEFDREASIWNRFRLRWFTSAGNGVAQSVTTGSTSVAITFQRQEPNATYGVLLTPSWATTCYVTNKATTGFTANFGTAPSGSAGSLDWSTMRSEDS